MKVTKILVPVDFSEISINALRYAADFARSSKAEMVILHITDPNSLINELKGNLDPAHLMNVLNHEKFMSGIKTTFLLQNGPIVNTIIDVAKSLDIDLIVMATRGMGNAARNIFGTTTTKVLGKTSCSVLVVPDEAVYKPLRRIIIATDLDKDSNKILREYIDIVKSQNVALLLMYVGKDDTGNFKRSLDKLTEDLKSQTSYNKIVSKLINSSEFPMQLEDFALNIEADLVVMNSHHRGVFESIFEPSESKLMAYHTTIPLLVIQQHKSPVYFL